MTRKKGPSAGNHGGSGIFVLFIVVLLALAGACGLYYASSKNKPKDLSDTSVTSFDLTEESKNAHKTVDDILLQKKDHWQLRDTERRQRSEKLPATGGEVSWTSREIAVGVPVTTDLEGAFLWVAERLRGTSLTVLNEGKAVWHEMDAYRLDLGIEVRSGKDSVRTFATDSLYFFHHGNLTNKDKDIPKPDKSRKDAAVTGKPVGKLAVVIDDCGYNNTALRELLDTQLPFAYAVIPFKEGSGEALRMIRSAGKTAMLHMAMEPIDRSQMSEGKKTITVEMSDREEEALLKEALDSLPGVQGVNNHQGSRATGDQQTMNVLMRVLKSRGLFFIDSRTSSRSVAYTTARRYGVPANTNELFLDNEASVEAIYARIQEAAERAGREGDLVVICHSRPATARAWSLYRDEIQKKGIRIVPVTELLR